MENGKFWLLLGSNLLSILLVVGGVLMAFNKIEGWGWLIFAALLVYGSPKSIITIKNKKNEKPKGEN
jgi:hypothetical protein